MKKLRRWLSIITMILTLTFASGSLVSVKATGSSGGPQGQQDTRSGGPSAPSGMTQAEYQYLLWLIWLWLLGWL